MQLPAYLTRLFGADLAAARLRAQVLAHRLVSLVGPGGSGKTRQAVEVAQSLSDPQAWAPESGEAHQPFDRVAFVPLAACEDPAQIPEAIAAALRLGTIAGCGPLARAGGT